MALVDDDFDMQVTRAPNVAVKQRLCNCRCHCCVCSAPSFLPEHEFHAHHPHLPCVRHTDQTGWALCRSVRQKRFLVVRVSVSAVTVACKRAPWLSYTLSAPSGEELETMEIRVLRDRGCVQAAMHPGLRWSELCRAHCSEQTLHLSETAYAGTRCCLGRGRENAQETTVWSGHCECSTRSSGSFRRQWRIPTSRRPGSMC